MDYLASSNVPVYATVDEQRALWERCAERGQPVLAVRDAARGYVVHYDLQHLDTELTQAALQALRDRVRSRRPYPTGTDPVSETEGVGGEPVRSPANFTRPPNATPATWPPTFRGSSSTGGTGGRPSALLPHRWLDF